MAHHPTEPFTFRAVTSGNWADFEVLFDGRGGPSACSCMVWRKGPDGLAPGPDRSARRAAMAGLVAQGTPVGLLGYREGQPVAWCAIAPRSTYGKALAAVRSGDTDLNLWSLVCFFVASPFRHTGLFGALLAAAEAEAHRQGAHVIEAYPVNPDSPSYRFSGFVGAFESAGYVRVGTDGTRRIVVRKHLPTA